MENLARKIYNNKQNSKQSSNPKVIHKITISCTYMALINNNYCYLSVQIIRIISVEHLLAHSIHTLALSYGILVYHHIISPKLKQIVYYPAHLMFITSFMPADLFIFSLLLRGWVALQNAPDKCWQPSYKQINPPC